MLPNKAFSQILQEAGWGLPNQPGFPFHWHHKKPILEAGGAWFLLGPDLVEQPVRLLSDGVTLAFIFQQPLWSTQQMPILKQRPIFATGQLSGTWENVRGHSP